MGRKLEKTFDGTHLLIRVDTEDVKWRFPPSKSIQFHRERKVSLQYELVER